MHIYKQLYFSQFYGKYHFISLELPLELTCSTIRINKKEQRYLTKIFSSKQDKIIRRCHCSYHGYCDVKKLLLIKKLSFHLFLKPQACPIFYSSHDNQSEESHCSSNGKYISHHTWLSYGIIAMTTKCRQAAVVF